MRSNRDTKLENVINEMYVPTPPVDVVKENDEDTGRIPHDVDSFGTKKKEYDPTKSKWYKDDPENDANIARDKHSQNLQTIKPLDELAAKHGADDIIDWLAQQVKQPGSNFVGWFEDIMNEI